MARAEAKKDPAASKSELFRELKSHGAILGGFVAFLWFVHLVNAVLFQGHLAALGVVPRSLSGLVGIFFAPFIHGSFAHLSSNTLPLLVLGWFVMLRRKRDFLYVSLLTALTSGIGTWWSGPSSSIWNEAAMLKICCPCWMATTRRLLKLAPSRLRSTS